MAQRVEKHLFRGLLGDSKMIRELKITRFKSIRSSNLSFGRVNLFIGGNGTGKSNILEAIGLVSSCIGRGLTDTDLGNKGLRVTPPELIKSSFKNEDLPKTLELDAKFDGGIRYKAVLSSRESEPLLRFFSESCLVGKKKIFGRSNRGASATGVPHADRLDPHRGLWDQIRATYDVPDAVDKVFSDFARFAIYTPQTDFLRGKQQGLLHTPPIGLHGEALPEAVHSLKHQWRQYRAKDNVERSSNPDDIILERAMDLVFLPGWASAVRVGKLSSVLTSRELADRSTEMVYFIDKFMHAKRNTLSVYDSSEGTLFLLFSTILLAHRSSPRVFALDNVDNALNPKLTRNLVERMIEITALANKSDAQIGAKQVFLTSHNPTSLDAFDLFDDQQRVFVVGRNEKGYTVVERLRPPEKMKPSDWELAKGGRNLSQLWLDGEISGALGSI
jgi:hypothetical protein